MRQSNETVPMRAPQWVRSWLWLLVGLVVIMVTIGGATRLTGSGLSITEWKPLTGAIPPLSEAAWLAEFDKYRLSSQYELLNSGMSLAAFKAIYWWEWSHRQFGRLIGLVFLMPFLILLRAWWRGNVTGSLLWGVLGIGALGGLQAGVGWIMVASGLTPGMVAVAPLKLMFHMVVAVCILTALVSYARALSPLARQGMARPLDRCAKLLVGLIFLQIALGALVAGSKAGLSYNTWPLMAGRIIPPLRDLLIVSPWYENFFDNVALVQFQHRMVAYVILVIAVIYARAVRKSHPQSHAAFQATCLAGLVLVQAALGIITLLLAVPLWAGLLHQILAMVVFITGSYHAFSVVRVRESRRAPERRGGKPVILEMDQSVNA